MFESLSMAGNMYKAFNQILVLGNETKLTPFGMVTAIVFKDFTISG